MKNRLFNALASLSLLLCLATPIVGIASHSADLGHWVHFATISRVPAVVDGNIEFGLLGSQHPFNRSARSLKVGGYSWSGPYEYGSARSYRSYYDVDDNFARDIVWDIGGIKETTGQLIPPAGWKVQLISVNSLAVPTVEIPYREFDLPVYYLMIPLAVPPAIWLKRKRLKTFRMQSGLCPQCGYDLRATPDKCPECGGAHA